MSNNKEFSVKPSSANEEEIFKSLAHNVRRDIIKEIGMSKELLFSEIQKRIKSIDSPTLSYHLKSLDPLLKNKEKKYRLSEIGKSAYYLLHKIDQSHTISKYKRRFIYAYIATVFCWITVQILVPTIIYQIDPQFKVPMYYFSIIVIIQIIAVINYIIIWKLKDI